MEQSPTIIRRTQRVAELAGQGMAVAEIRDTLADESIINPRTDAPYSLSTIRKDLHREPVSEMIGRVAIDYTYVSSGLRNLGALSVDRTIPDYAAWDKLRRGTLAGFEIGGLFGKPITETLTAFVLGKGLTVSLADGGDANDENDPRTKTDRALEAFMGEIHATLLQVTSDHYGLGDQYVIVNADGTLSVASPETVTLEHDPLDYRRVVKVTITTELEQAQIKDVYTAQARALTVTWKTTTPEHRANTERTTTYANLIGEIPVVHFACERSANETFGHPIYAPLFRLLSRYDDLIEKALDGVELMGNPIPVFTGVEDVQKTLKAMKTATDEDYIDADGYADQRTVIRMDKLPLWILGKGADAKFVAPQIGFTKDIISMLGMLFILICDFTRIPEFMFGASVEQSRASAETQLPPFIQYVELLRARLENDILTLVRLWLKMKHLTTPSMVVDRVRVTYPEISLDTAQITLQKTIYARGEGMLTRKRGLELLHLVPDAQKEVQLAQQEVEQQAQDEYQTMLNAAAHQQMNPVNNQPNTDTPKTPDLNPPLPAGGRRAQMQNGKRVGEMNPLPDGIDPDVIVVNGDGKRRKRRRRARATAPVEAAA